MVSPPPPKNEFCSNGTVLLTTWKLVEDLTKFMILGKLFVYAREVGSADVSLYPLAVWGVVPNFVALFVSSFCLDGVWLLYLRLLENRLDMRAFSLIGSALLNSLSLHDLSVILRLIANTYFYLFLLLCVFL